MIRENMVGSLALTHCSRAPQRIYIPNLYVRRKILDSHLACHWRSRLAAPYDAELRFRSLIQDINQIPWLQLGVNTLQRRAAATDATKAGRLCERAGKTIHTPNLDWQINEDTRLAAPIHVKLLAQPQNQRPSQSILGVGRG
jgi:hypothetical protein